MLSLVFSFLPLFQFPLVPHLSIFCWFIPSDQQFNINLICKINAFLNYHSPHSKNSVQHTNIYFSFFHWFFLLAKKDKLLIVYCYVCCSWLSKTSYDECTWLQYHWQLWALPVYSQCRILSLLEELPAVTWEWAHEMSVPGAPPGLSKQGLIQY